MTPELPPKDIGIGRADLSRVVVGSPAKALAGYMHPWYAESLREFGRPRELPRCGGWILERQVPGFPYHDAMGCYPLFVCRDWSQLHIDLENLSGSDLVSLSLVVDPFGEYDIDYLCRCFKDLVFPFKQHFVVDLSRPMNTFVRKGHKRSARKAAQHLNAEICKDPMLFIDDWINLYSDTLEKHKLRGIHRFSRFAFAKQMSIPGMVAFRAFRENTTLAMVLWYIQGDIGYSHLGGQTPEGHELNARSLLYWVAIEYFAAAGLRWLDLGAGPGTRGNSTDGVSEFKRGWATGTRPAYFCGRIFDHEKYSAITKAAGISATDYFPAYRKGEFG